MTAPADTKECAGCRQGLPLSMFWKRGKTDPMPRPRCIPCMGGQEPREQTKPAPVLTCTECKGEFPRKAFSPSQLRKGLGDQRCRECTRAARRRWNNTTRGASSVSLPSRTLTPQEIRRALIVAKAEKRRRSELEPVDLEGLIAWCQVRERHPWSAGD
jgi:hypothetical protein